jgi:hypothetical protein
MDSIDITDSNFALSGFPESNIEPVFDKVLIETPDQLDYTKYLYLGLAILLFAVGVFLYRQYTNSRTNENRVRFAE